MKKIIRNYLLTVFLVICIGQGAFAICVNAQEGDKIAVAELNQFVTALEKVDVREAPEQDAAVIFSYEAGEVIFLTGETENGWYSVFFQGQTGYINMSETQGSLQTNEMDVDALNKEMESEEALGKLIVEEVERYRSEATRSKIWGTVIVLLIVGILATGIVSTIQAERARRKEEDKNEQDANDNQMLIVGEETQEDVDKVIEDDIWDLDKE